MTYSPDSPATEPEPGGRAPSRRARATGANPEPRRSFRRSRTVGPIGARSSAVQHEGPGGDAAPPGTPVSRRWIAGFTLAWFGYWMANLVPIQLLLPTQLAEIDPVNKVRDLAIVNGVAGLIALITLPVCGALCDRTVSRFGRRRSWIAGGALLFALAVAILGQQSTAGGVVAFWALAMVGASATMGGLTAVIADRVPEHQRGTISSAIYGPQALGVVIGIAAVSIFGLSTGNAYLLIAAALVLCALPFVWRYRENLGVRSPALTLRDVLASLWVNPRTAPEFGWAFGSRTLVNLGNSLGTCYMLFFLTDALHVGDPEGSLLSVTLVYLASALLFTYVAGTLSDRLGRRKIFVAIAALMQTVAGVILVFFPTFELTIVAGAFMGGGFGAYMAVGQAVVTAVLPDPDNRAKDLGIMNVGSSVPTAIAPLIAAVLITVTGGYTALFLVTAVFSAIGAAMIYRVRSVR